ncbi:hypothetical protein AM587_10003815 [Phytophthora nicotianae]|uniref:Uncharacterized protein n=2 Tax=Phytophthora nicotianae TaxID=4792 RepID=V9FB13_PHYNI|nr:hypothetical protein F443_07327 [Phytophthora nicotianae P1569]ETL41974.1 hypothetical protein L916_07136 [Phytophthora nicotianae]KUG00621.1 hypothetical protein AM587_10000165 [Phytophthora nicotianae]KUG02112.1 hypothetical protein AM587_10003815 [Phytophthora nicotianae]
MAFQITSILTLLVLCLAVVAADFVHFFVDTNFRTSGGHWIYNFSKSQFCINMGVFDDKVSSAQWRDLPQNGSFADNHALVAFYSGGNCTGTVRTWPTVEKNFPTDFALDRIDKQISSFMVWQTSNKVEEIAPDPRFLD